MFQQIQFFIHLNFNSYADDLYIYITQLNANLFYMIYGSMTVTVSKNIDIHYTYIQTIYYILWSQLTTA